MAFDNITVEQVEHTVPKKLPKKKPVTNEKFRVIGGPENADIQILYKDCSGRPIFSEAEAVEIARQFLNDNPDPEAIPMFPENGGNSRYALYTVGGEKNLGVHCLDIRTRHTHLPAAG